MWRYVHPDAPVPLPPDHELDTLRRLAEHELASSALVLTRMVLDLHERDFRRTSDSRSHTFMLYTARLSCYVLLTLLQRAAVLTAGYFPDIMELLLFYKVTLLVQILYSEYMSQKHDCYLLLKFAICGNPPLTRSVILNLEFMFVFPISIRQLCGSHRKKYSST